MLVYYLVSNYQKQLVFTMRDIDLHSNYSSYLSKKISFGIIFQALGFFAVGQFAVKNLKKNLTKPN